MRSPPFWASILTISGILILCGLGTWQIIRLQWKTELLAALETEYQKDPMSFELTAHNLESKSEQLFIKGFAEGIYRHHDTIKLQPRTYKGETGVHIITPFELLDNHIILVNRGWIPLHGKESDYIKPSEPLIITGIARKPDQPNIFVPGNNSAQNQWYSLIPEDIAAAKNLGNILPYIFYVDESYKSPISVVNQWSLPNNHRGYAIFWFTMAIILAGIYYGRFIHLPKKKNI